MNAKKLTVSVFILALLAMVGVVVIAGLQQPVPAMADRISVPSQQSTCHTYSKTGPFAIPDNTGASLDSIMILPPLGYTTDLTVTLTLSHQKPDDLKLELCIPGRTCLLEWEEIYTPGAIVSTTFSFNDHAPNTPGHPTWPGYIWNDPNGVTEGATYLPDSSGPWAWPVYSPLVRGNQPAGGSYTLRLTDGWNTGKSGTLDAWSLTVCAGAVGVTPTPSPTVNTPTPTRTPCSIPTPMSYELVSGTDVPNVWSKHVEAPPYIGSYSLFGTTYDVTGWAQWFTFSGTQWAVAGGIYPDPGCPGAVGVNSMYFLSDTREYYQVGNVYCCKRTITWSQPALIGNDCSWKLFGGCPVAGGGQFSMVMGDPIDSPGEACGANGVADTTITLGTAYPMSACGTPVPTWTPVPTRTPKPTLTPCGTPQPRGSWSIW